MDHTSNVGAVAPPYTQILKWKTGERNYGKKKVGKPAYKLYLLGSKMPEMEIYGSEIYQK